MLHNDNRRRADAGLPGEQFQPPPKPKILRSGARTEISDWRGAKDIGQAGAEAFELSDAHGQYHYEGLIDAEAESAIASTSEGYEEARGHTERVEGDARLQREDAEPVRGDPAGQ